MDLTVPYTFYPLALPHWIAWALFTTALAAGFLLGVVKARNDGWKTGVVTGLLVGIGCLALINYGAFGPRWRGVVRCAERLGLVLGGIGFVAGFFDPMILKPDANQGPLLGIFSTGPAGFVIGLVYGIVRELLGQDSTSSAA